MRKRWSGGEPWIETGVYAFLCLDALKAGGCYECGRVIGREGWRRQGRKEARRGKQSTPTKLSLRSRLRRASPMMTMLMQIEVRQKRSVP